MIVKFNFLSKALMKQTNVTMILPSWTLFDGANGKQESYQKNIKFQTLYLFHGGTGDDSDYVNFSNITRYANEHKLAVIMPCGYNSGYIDDGDDKLPFPGKYWTYIFEELPQVCSAMFPISTKREDTFVGGLSMGAMAAIKWAVYGADRCCAALLMSGGGMDMGVIQRAVSEDNNGGTDFEVNVDRLTAKGIQLLDRESDLYKTANKIAREGKQLPKIYMTCGGNDFIRVFVHACRDELNDYGFNVFYEEVPGYTHEWDFWDLSLKKAIEKWLPISHEIIIEE